MRASSAGAGHPDRVGPFEIVRLLGVGGMGVVYEAKQARPQRSVALKLIKPGFVTDSLLRRFEREADIVGRLQHPGVAQVYEVGTAGGGASRQPYFAMELVRGQPMTEYARARNLSLRARLDLMTRVCDAVQYAHQQGVVHRDLKPGNILVDESGQPKVLDFGIAKITSADNPTATAETQTGQILGTLAYMSPEQARGESEKLDTRADIYALGVIAYELLAGRHPYDLAHRVIVEAVRVICEEEPARLSSVHRTLRGDVETIIAKAMAKERERRYASVSEFAGDIRRFLSDEPIAARPPSAWYQASKFARRNKAVVGGVAAVLFALVLGVIGTSVGLVNADRARNTAEQEERRARAAEKDALEQRAASDEQRRIAEEQSEKAQRTLYLQSIALASRELPDNVAAAKGILDRCPDRFRDWEWRHLRLRADQSVASFRPAPDVIHTGTCLAWSPDGASLLAIYGEPVVLDAETGRVRLRLRSKSGSIFRAAWDASGKLIATLDHDAMLTTWNAQTGEKVRSWQPGSAPAGDLAWSPRGATLATADGTPSIRLWNAGDGSEAGAINVSPSREYTSWTPASVRWSPTGDRVVYGAADGTIRVVNTDADHAESKLGSFKLASIGALREIAWSRGGDRIAVAHIQGLELLMPGNPDSRSTIPATGPAGRAVCTSVSWNPRDDSLAASLDRTLLVWPRDPFQRPEPLELRGHDETIRSIAWRPDGKRLASQDIDGVIRLWDTEPSRLPVVAPNTTLHHLDSIDCDPAGHWLAVSGEANGPERRGIELVDLRMREQTKRVEGLTSRVFALNWSPDGKTIAMLFEDRLAMLDVATLALTDGDAYGDQKIPRERIAWSGDGTLVAAAVRLPMTPAPPVLVYDARGRIVRRLDTGPDPVAAMAWSPDNRRLAVGGGKGVAVIYDEGKMTPSLRIKADELGIGALVWSPDGKHLITGGIGRPVCAWDASTGVRVASYDGIDAPAKSLAFSHTGTRLLAATEDELRLWDTPTRQLLLAIPLRAIEFAAWTPDGDKVYGYTRRTSQPLFVIHAIGSQAHASQ